MASIFSLQLKLVTQCKGPWPGYPSLPGWEGTFAQAYSNGHQDSTKMACDGTMVYRAHLLKTPGHALLRVNDPGVPHPDPRYQEWFYRKWDRHNAWEYFRFTKDGELDVHHFCTDGHCHGTSPLGASAFCCSSFTTEGGTRCKPSK